ncbi:sigma 54-interacting transcriptional regulator [Alicyclobacillus tolerans]|uniref:sigma 54-interacting transcriptional regulator n=1 Tax=Alicyclobacillus tolerans TaxID=90970 RepID=UPI001EFF6077|nr:sigma 54-interacting transcriptional regulator [Alicyclobacillus tolerans]MCF8564716.1 sigma 54-interacting transcriptional regulator [Alicyclobacillus tolerans]
MESRQVEAFLTAILESSNDAITGIDQDGVVIYWNAAAEEVYGIAKGEIVGQKIGSFFQEESVVLFQVLNSGLPVSKVYHRPRPDKHVFINAVPVLSADSAVLGAVSIEQDITHIVKLSAQQYSRIQQAERSNPALPIFESEFAKNIVNLIANSSLSGSPHPFLLTGDPGVGKKSLAELSHARSRRPGEMLTFACDSFPPGLVDFELFGFEGQAFDSEREVRVGKLELAGEGTLYLANVHRLPVPTQKRLAQALHDKQFTRNGSDRPVALRCQILASAPPNLQQYVAESRFSEKLYYIFHHLHVPSLRERKAEILSLFRYYLVQFSKESGRPVPEVSPEAVAAVRAYEWPGNIPELRNAVQHAVLFLKEAEMGLSDLPDSLRPTMLRELIEDAVPLATLSGELEKAKIEETLKRTGGNKASAAKVLGISRGALYYKLKQYGMNNDVVDSPSGK